MHTNFDDSRVTLELEQHERVHFEEFLQREIRKNRLFQSEREEALIAKHDRLRNELIHIREMSKGAMMTFNNEPIDETAMKLAGALFALTETLNGDWDFPEGDENADEQSNIG